ncbi:hypothetical protein GCM10010365_15770 [Streptomyces poonensis]|uniref:Uncharacterized protein n=1 Tax=Streptomyces poonensis TaxID=68255 RepID=A0A918PCC3_9ACTN|nr:hypothetical protein GCM10010365_15770 [Streptomyces poonensis]
MNVLETDATRKRVSHEFGTDHRRDAIPNARASTGSPRRVTRTVPENPFSAATSVTASSRRAGSHPSALVTIATAAPTQKMFTGPR